MDFGSVRMTKSTPRIVETPVGQVPGQLRDFLQDDRNSIEQRD